MKGNVKRLALISALFAHFDSSLIPLELKGTRNEIENFYRQFSNKSEDGSRFRYIMHHHEGNVQACRVICFLPSEAKVAEVLSKAKSLGLSRGNISKKHLKILVSVG